MILEYNNFIFDLNTSILKLKNTKTIKKYTLKKEEILNFSICQKAEADRDIHNVNIIPTMRCLGNCNYCYNTVNNNKNDDNITLNTLINVINDIKKKYKSLNIQQSRMYGGEPLLNPNIYEILTYLYNAYKTNFYISSGLLFNNLFFEECINNFKKMKCTQNISIGISSDLASNTRRNTFNLDYLDLYERCHILNKEDLFSRVICVNTVSSNTKIDDLLKIIENDKSGLFFRIAIACTDNVNSISEDGLAKIYHFFINNIENNKITSNVFPYFNVLNSPKIMELEKGHFFLKYPSKYCDKFYSTITINPLGKIVPCHMDPYAKSNLKFELDSTCKNCSHVLVCFGGCHHRREFENRKIYCDWIKMSFDIGLRRLDNILSKNGIDNIYAFLSNNIF